jgi:hypothetical protein
MQRDIENMQRVLVLAGDEVLTIKSRLAATTAQIHNLTAKEITPRISISPRATGFSQFTMASPLRRR